MAEFLWWTLQEILAQKEQRKMLMIVSDGFPDNVRTAQEAIMALIAHDIEVYGIGIQTAAMTRLLPEKRSRTIYDLHDLAPAVFELLKSALLQIKGKNYESVH